MFTARLALRPALGALLLPCALATNTALADFITIVPSKDNSIFEEGDLSNGQGSLFAGVNGQIHKRRALIAFDIASSLPSGATIEDVSLNMVVGKSEFGGQISLHRLTEDWGESTSNSFDGGIGAPAEEGDATWNQSFFSAAGGTLWSTPGGSFVPDVSSTQFIPAFTFDTPFVFASGPIMVSDVQGWLDHGGNFGWIMVGDETRSADAVRFDDRGYFDTAGRPTLTIQYSAGGPPQWNLDGDGSWGDANNWSGGVPDDPAAVANFLGTITADRIITLNGNRTVATINFDSPHSYTIAPGSGGSLTVGSGTQNGLIHVAQGSHLFTAGVNVGGPTEISLAGDTNLELRGGLMTSTGISLTKTGGGTLRIGGPQQHGPGTSLLISEGKVFFDSNAGAPATESAAADANLSMTIQGNNSGSNSIVVLNSDLDLSSINIAYNDEGSQGIDLNSSSSSFHSVRLHGGDLGAQRSFVAAAIANAKIFSVGDGIFDSGLHPSSAIGVGQFIDAHGDPYLLIRPTRIGDLNLDGAVTIADFIDLAGHFNQSGLWQEGDMNGDGLVTIGDFIDLAANFNQIYAGGAIPISESDQQMLSSFAAAHGASLVPEPSVFAMLSLGLLGLGRRRRRA